MAFKAKWQVATHPLNYPYLKMYLNTTQTPVICIIPNTGRKKKPMVLIYFFLGDSKRRTSKQSCFLDFTSPQPYSLFPPFFFPHPFVTLCSKEKLLKLGRHNGPTPNIHQMHIQNLYTSNNHSKYVIISLISDHIAPVSNTFSLKEGFQDQSI